MKTSWRWQSQNAESKAISLVSASSAEALRFWWTAIRALQEMPPYKMKDSSEQVAALYALK